MRFLITIALTFACSIPAAAQSKSAASGNLGVDLVRLKNGRTMRGALWQRSPEGGVLMVVRREWLQRADGRLAEETAATNRAQQELAWKETRDRIDSRLAEVSDAPRYTFFLKQESERLQKLLETPADDAEFLWLELEGKQVAQVAPAPPARQRVALWGWSEGLADVETREVGSLARELQKAGIKVEASTPDLSDRVPVRPQSEREWLARLAIVEYALRKPLDLQGTGDTVFPITSGKRIDVAAVMPALMERQLQSVLAELTGAATPKPAERAWLPSAIRQAEEADVRGFRATRVDVTAEQLTAHVTSEFVVQLSEKWVSVWQAVENTSGGQPRPEEEARIAGDPQVKAALDAVKALGLDAEANVRSAMRVGAATMSAQQAIDQRFFEFRDHYLKRLDGPVLIVPGS